MRCWQQHRSPDCRLVNDYLVAWQFSGYNITSAADKLAALNKTTAHLAGQSKHASRSNVVEMPKDVAAGQ